MSMFIHCTFTYHVTNAVYKCMLQTHSQKTTKKTPKQNKKPNKPNYYRLYRYSWQKVTKHNDTEDIKYTISTCGLK